MKVVETIDFGDRIFVTVYKKGEIYTRNLWLERNGDSLKIKEDDFIILCN